MFKIDSTDSPTDLTKEETDKEHEWASERASALKELKLISVWYLCNVIACGTTAADLSLREG